MYQEKHIFIDTQCDLILFGKCSQAGRTLAYCYLITNFQPFCMIIAQHVTNKAIGQINRFFFTTYI